MFLLGAKSQVRQLLAAKYSADLEETSAASPEELGSIDVSAGDLEGEADWNWPIRRKALR